MPEEGFRSRLWKLLNSSFVLWLLSTVVVALVGRAWADRVAEQQRRAADAEVLSRLRIEIADRFVRMDIALMTQPVSPEAYIEECRRAGIFEPSGEQLGRDEFMHRPLASLLWQVDGLRPDLRPNISRAQGLLTMVRRVLSGNTFPADSRVRMRVANRLLGAMGEQMKAFVDVSVEDRAAGLDYAMSVSAQFTTEEAALATEEPIPGK